jgi:putative transposase
VDFLPVIRRTLTRTGFTIGHVQYYCDALKPWIARRRQLGKFILRRDPRDPRDVSRIWALDPDANAYLEVPYRTLSRPPVSAWEQEATAARLREAGRADVDETALFAMIGQPRPGTARRGPGPA